jgi:hypothetical protein
MSLVQRLAVLMLSVTSLVLSAVNVAHAGRAGWDCGAAACAGTTTRQCFNCCEDKCGHDTFGCQGFCLGEPRPAAVS